MLLPGAVKYQYFKHDKGAERVLYGQSDGRNKFEPPDRRTEEIADIALFLASDASKPGERCGYNGGCGLDGLLNYFSRLISPAPSSVSLLHR
jgi:hypothetical protein